MCHPAGDALLLLLAAFFGLSHLTHKRDKC
jgi:hypothetical protein